MAVDPGLSFEGIRHDIDAVMRLPAGPGTGMARVQMRLVLHIEASRREAVGQLLGNDIDGAHIGWLSDLRGMGSMVIDGQKNANLSRQDHEPLAVAPSKSE
jgi:hypothetical protein